MAKKTRNLDRVAVEEIRHVSPLVVSIVTHALRRYTFNLQVGRYC